MNLDWNTYAYTQILAEIVTSLFPEGERDEEVYQLLNAYAETIDYKDVRTATIIAGWQLIASAGFFLISTGFSYIGREDLLTDYVGFFYPIKRKTACYRND